MRGEQKNMVRGRPQEVMFQSVWQPTGACLTALLGGRRVVGPRARAWSCGWERGASRPRQEKHTSASLPYTRRGENTETEFAKLVLFSSAKPLLPFLVTQVEHWGEVLTSRGCAGPEQGSFLQPGGSWVQSHEHAGG